MQHIDTQEHQTIKSEVVGSILERTCNTISGVWSRHSNESCVCTILLFSLLEDYNDLMELKFPKRMVSCVIHTIPRLTPTADETTQILQYASHRKHLTASHLCEHNLVSQRIAQVEHCLQLTLKEPAPAKTWTNPTTKLVCVFLFHTKNFATITLQAILGAVVRADIRRCNDLHDCQCREPLDTLTMCALVECLSLLLVL